MINKDVLDRIAFGGSVIALFIEHGGEVMPALGMSHVAFCVRDIEQSLAFYRDALGFRVLNDRLQETTTGGLPHVYKYRRATRRQVTLAYGEGDARPQLVITEHPGEPPDGDPIKLDQIGISHLSFTVPSVAQLTEDLLAKGYKTAGPPDAFKDASGRVRTVFFVDPDGILVQFDEGGGG
jgi:catechol 2,3-dioxygenase-like lactoylglutathione lyase family enzyme